MTVATILAAKGRHIVTTEPHHSLQEAARLLAERRIGAVLIGSWLIAASSCLAVTLSRQHRAGRARAGPVAAPQQHERLETGADGIIGTVY